MKEGFFRAVYSNGGRFLLADNIAFTKMGTIFTVPNWKRGMKSLHWDSNWNSWIKQTEFLISIEMHKIETIRWQLNIQFHHHQHFLTKKKTINPPKKEDFARLYIGFLPGVSRAIQAPVGITDWKPDAIASFNRFTDLNRDFFPQAEDAL